MRSPDCPDTGQNADALSEAGAIGWRRWSRRGALWLGMPCECRVDSARYRPGARIVLLGARLSATASAEGLGVNGVQKFCVPLHRPTGEKAPSRFRRLVSIHASAVGAAADLFWFRSGPT